jgi:hypothetical protein
LAESQSGPFDRMHGRDEATSSTDERLGIESFRQPEHVDAGLHPQGLGPTTQQAVARAIRDAVDAPVRAPRRLPGHEALIASVAGAVHIEKCDQVPDGKWAAVHVIHRKRQLAYGADRDMPGDDGEGNSREPAVVNVDVSATHFRVSHIEQGGARGKRRCSDLLHPDRLVRRVHYRRGEGPAAHPRRPVQY